MTQAQLSQKITILSIAAMFSVILIHSITILTSPNPARWSVFVQHLISRSFTDWAVPFFFAVSGFWFSKGIAKTTDTKSFFLKKFKSLVVPYLCWATIGLIIALPLLVGNNWLSHRGLFERTLFEIPGLWNKIDAFFAFTHAGPKGNAPLWYVRSLIVMFSFFPIWRVLLSRKVGVVIIAVFGVLQISPISITIPYLSVFDFAWGWFALGIVVASVRLEDKRVPDWLGIVVSSVFVLFSIFKALHVAGYMSCGFHGWIIQPESVK